MRKNLKRTLACLLAFIMCVCAMPMGNFTAKAVEYKVGDIIEFGSYPQSRVTDESLLEQLNAVDINWTANKCYSGTGYIGTMQQGEWMKYADIDYENNKYRAVYFSKYVPEETVNSTSADDSYQDDNGYYPDNIYWFKYEPIQWIVLNPETGLVISEKIIDVQAYNNTVYGSNMNYYSDTQRKNPANDYKTSSMREWLNNDFFGTAFQANEQSIIKDTVLSDNSDVSDKNVLISYNQYSSSNIKSKVAYGSDYSKCLGLYVDSGDGVSEWWLSTPGSYSFGAYLVYNYGYVSHNASYYVYARKGVRPAMTLDLSRINDENKEFPDGYDFKRDRYQFSNPKDSIDLKIYQRDYGTMHGWLLYTIHEQEEHGMCYGMASTTSAFIKYPETLKTFKDNKTDKVAECIHDFGWLSHQPTYFSDYFQKMNTKEMIKRAYILQLDNTMISIEKKSRDKFDEIIDKAIQYRDGNGEPLILTLRNGLNDQHAVFVAGIKSTDDSYEIAIDDSNNLEMSYLTMSKDYSSWSYTSGDFEGTIEYSSEKGSSLGYLMIADVIYYGMRNESYLSENNLLVASNNNIESNKDLTPIDAEFAASINSQYSDKYRLYWSDEYENNINIKTLSDNTNLVVSGVNSAIESTLPANKNIEITIDDNNGNSLKSESDIGENANFKFMTSSANSFILNLAVTGTASADSVTATQTETGIVVSGLSDGTVTLSKDDEIISKQEITGAVSDIEITYDKDGSTDDMNVDYDVAQHEHTDKNNDGKCDICGEKVEEDKPSDPVGNCTCLCHKTGFLGFIYKIARIFWKIFKINPTCACGQKHY